MKRWQDCGEVADSEEEEELVLESSSKSTDCAERSPKRARLDEGAGTGPVSPQDPASASQHSPSGDDDEIAWLPTKQLATYGKKGRLVRPNLPLNGLHKSTEPRRVLLVSVPKVHAEKSPVHREEEQTTPLEQTNNPQLVSSQSELPPGSHSEDLLPSSCMSSPLSSAPSISSSDSESLPRVRDILAAAQQLSRHQKGRVASPPDRHGPHGVQEPVELSGRASLFVHNEPAIVSPAPERHTGHDDFIPPASTARRSLRARKEVQLHPYLIDKAKYQRQCRERGLRPVRLVDQESQHEEEQSQGNEHAAYPSSASSVPDARPRRSSVENDGFGSQIVEDGHLPRVEPERHPSQYRRVVSGKKKPRQENHLSTDQFLAPDTGSRGFSIPPSPPPTSSGQETSNAISDSPPRAVFRYPRAMTPLHLPTPQISSAMKSVDLDDESDSDVPRKSVQRTRTVNRDSLDDLTDKTSTSDESSETDVEERIIRQEQKRIRGVLPASWLKVNLLAQNGPSSTGGQTNSTKSPDKTNLPKGVARRVAVGRKPHNANDDVVNLDDNEESDSSVQFLKSAQKSSGVTPRRQQDRDVSQMDVDFDEMEEDVVDAMLTRTSRKSRSRRGSINQRRLAELPGVRRIQRDPEHVIRRDTERHPRRENQNINAETQRRRRKAPRPPRLSIADAPTSSSAGSTRPQFVRLALRRTRQLPDRGRHSPSGKSIRLATANETLEAETVLRDWETGAIAPQSSYNQSSLNPGAASPSSRGPLATISSNHIQSTLGLSDRPNNFNPTAPSCVIRKPRLRQTQLRMETISPLLRDAPQKSSGADHARPQKFKRPSTNPPKFRAAQLESLQPLYEQEHRAALFERRLQCLTENVVPTTRVSRVSHSDLARPVPGERAKTRLPLEADDGHAESIDDTSTTTPQVIRAVIRRPRKRNARRLHVEHEQYKQHEERPLIVEHGVDDEWSTTNGVSEVLRGLGAYGQHFPVDFEITPLAPGTYVHANSLIGSGDFHNAMHLVSRDAGSSHSSLLVQVDGRSTEWGVWTENVAADIAHISSLATQALQPSGNPAQEGQGQDRFLRLDTYLRSVIWYCTEHVQFLDPIDRQGCAESLNSLVAGVSDIVAGVLEVENRNSLALRVSQYMVVIGRQAVELSSHAAVSHEARTQSTELLCKASKILFYYAVSKNIEQLRLSYQQEIREASVDCEQVALSSLVILNHSMSHCSVPRGIWQCVEEHLCSRLDQLQSVQDLDRAWRSLFTILPTLEIDDMGIIKVASIQCHAQSGSIIVRKLLCRVFNLYEASSQVRSFTVNAYLRALLARCHCLSETWGWTRFESILFTIYDFFSKRNLCFLNKEASRGSLDFLDQLSTQPLLGVMPDDLSFHIFLKLLASTLLRMRKDRVYEDRKIGGSIIWRLIPSHGRMYAKEKDMQQTDLDSLQNHHDLLCTLYYVAPPGHRPQIELLRNLVDHTTSHRDACRVSVRSWTIVTSFQSSTTEPAEALDGLIDWFLEIMTSTLAQHRLAKTEAENDSEQARNQGVDIAEAVLRGTIINNQRIITGTIVDALAGLRKAILSAQCVGVVRKLVAQTNFWMVFELFEPSQQHLSDAMVGVLEVVQTALDTEQRLTAVVDSQSSGESQEFGDYSALHELVASDDAASPLEDEVAETVFKPTSHFMSSVFGADSTPEEPLLRFTIDVWIKLAASMVKSGQTTWMSYVDQYSATSWRQLRDTRQKRKFSAYFYSRVIEQSPTDQEVVQSVLSAWLLSLVEREAVMKHQNDLTVALLHYCGDDRLLQSLPFARDFRTDLYMITLDEVKQRRLALISSILCNMRQCLGSGSNAEELRSTYKGMVVEMMQAMKSNYQELQGANDSEPCQGTPQGAYVEFVHQVISLLQQHTSEFCRVDKFFTDASVFPLPDTDPSYVVGKLKGYALRLSERKTQKELTIFLQSVSERAAMDAKQPDLIRQLSSAMSQSDRVDNDSALNLRSVLFTAILPAYLSSTLSSPCAWLQAVPILQACVDIMFRMPYDTHSDDDDDVNPILVLLHEIHRSVEQALTQPHLGNAAPILRTLTIMFDACRSALHVAAFLQHSQPPVAGLLHHRLHTLYQRGADVHDHLQDAMTDARRETSAPVAPEPRRPWPETRDFAETHFRDSLRNWVVVDGHYFVYRGGGRKEVRVDLDSAELERDRLEHVIVEYRGAYAATFAPRLRKLRFMREDGCGLKDVLV